MNPSKQFSFEKSNNLSILIGNPFLIEILKTSLNLGKFLAFKTIFSIIFFSDRDVRSLVEEDRENAGIADENIKEFGQIDESTGLDEYEYLRNNRDVIDNSKKTSEKFKNAWRDIEKLGNQRFI